MGTKAVSGGLIVLMLLAAAPACASEEKTTGGDEMSKSSITITSAAFAAGQPIPKKFTGEGRNISPPLAISGVPKSAKALALICDDPDAPRPQPFVHWVLYNIPPGVTTIGEGENGGGTEGMNDTGKPGYTGPMPPPGHGVHHYHFKLHALDQTLELGADAAKADLLKAMAGHILAEGELIGTYERK